MWKSIGDDVRLRQWFGLKVGAAWTFSFSNFRKLDISSETIPFLIAETPASATTPVKPWSCGRVFKQIKTD
ncbi:hypothetical protein HanRHA438_Chr05g0230041 [Helianthus annuus]|uniref:Uncharacterized protein n=1 Tax=Helianthus annuus TaxID=4232 RepID=A0A9K3J0Q1_HELAN|nr:hypothetical protein HanXRQr2_Chr05g0221171 [Helianthus annuus]KAJ0570687.1 hypothetical protein HanHA300_Chr05g0180921 [Helianthus annuus]KAJ0585030.1 hypothetical protein HanHA89_Chr05g0195621 [Helianthus annuus]KAJ0747591.1 hypothetical protein HanOQP8_Chr05g0191311 [Helianthus annuus]KAJ0919471.1 hypothetical protein HanRHA438_Chr05g0230041 [Helianthus annuus]